MTEYPEDDGLQDDLYDDMFEIMKQEWVKDAVKKQPTPDFSEAFNEQRQYPAPY